MASFYWDMDKVAKVILQALADGIGLEDEDFFIPMHSGHNNQLRLLHYPPVPAADLENQSVARMPAHSDWGSITLCFQDDCGGLQVGGPDRDVMLAKAIKVENPHQEGAFVAVPPLKDAIILNVGDLLQRWSNGGLM